MNSLIVYMVLVMEVMTIFELWTTLSQMRKANIALRARGEEPMDTFWYAMIGFAAQFVCIALFGLLGAWLLHGNAWWIVILVSAVLMFLSNIGSYFIVLLYSIHIAKKNVAEQMKQLQQSSQNRG